MAAFLDFDGLSRFYDNLKTYIASVVDNPVDLSNYVKKTQDQTIDGVYINGGTSETQGASLLLSGIVQGDSSPWQLTTRKGDYYYSWYGDSDGKLHFFTDDTRKERTSDVVAYISDLTPYALTSSLDGYLPLTGGTITGVITAFTPTGVAPYVIDTSDPENAPDDPVDKAWISANRKNGAFFEASEDGTIYSRLVLRYPSHATQSGHFQLRAMNGTASSTLIGTPEGSLTWKGNELATDSDVVHLNGTEAIIGTKNFQAAPNIQRTTITKGTAPSGSTWWTLGFTDKDGSVTKNRLGAVETSLDTLNNVISYLRAYKAESNSTAFSAVTVAYPASGSPYATAPTTPTGSTGTEIVTADYLNSTNSGVVHTTGNETIAGNKTFSGLTNFSNNIYIAEAGGICFTNNGVTQRLISTTQSLQSVSGNNAVSLRLGYGGSTYVTGGECAGYITTDNGFAYSNENVQLMADSNVYIRTGLNGGWNADLGAVATNAAFRPIADGGMTLGTDSYRWGNAYIGTTYMNGSIVFDETATISGTSTRHLANISMNNSSLNFGAYDQTNSKWIWWATPAGVNTFNGNASTATKATQDGNGNVISSTYAKDADVVHLAGAETITGAKTFSNNITISNNVAEIKVQYPDLAKGTLPDFTATRDTLELLDSNNRTLATINYKVAQTGKSQIGFVAYDFEKTTNAINSLGIGFDGGTVYTFAPTPATTDDSTQIATTEFVQNHAAKKINISGSRGNLAGYQTPVDQAAAFTLNYNTRDIVNLTAAVKVTVTNSAGSSAAWIKYVFIHNAGATVALGNKWHWKDSTTPTISANSVLVLMWCKTFGIADLIK